jgi:hypothetical protein
MNKEEKPYVCICSFLVKSFPKKYMNRLKSKNKAVKDKAIKDYAKVDSIENYPLTLDSEDKFPTKKTKQRIIKEVWLYLGKKEKLDSFVVSIASIVVKSKSRVSYEFDYDKN